MAGNGVHTVHKGEEWLNEIDGRQVGAAYGLKDDAVGAGRQLAQERQLEHHIHNLDGTIGERNSYGNDPRNVPG